MIKKLTLTSIAALSLLFVSANAESVKKCNSGMKCAAGKCGSGMAKKPNVKPNMKMKHKKKRNSPFLIKHGLPHLTKLVMKNWDNPALALSEKQKLKLEKVRMETMGFVKSAKSEVMALKKEIIEASKAGTKAADLKEKVEKLAALEAEATIVHLECLDSTRATLSKEQLATLRSFKKH